MSFRTLRREQHSITSRRAAPPPAARVPQAVTQLQVTSSQNYQKVPVVTTIAAESGIVDIPDDSIHGPAPQYTIDDSFARLTNYGAALNKLPVVDLMSVEMYVASSEEIISRSDCVITNTNTVGEGSVNDLRMGTIETDVLCLRCKQDAQHCQGHMGRMKFEEMMYNPIFSKKIHKILGCVCHWCSAILLDKIPSNVNKLKGLTRVEALSKLSKGLECRSVKLLPQDCTLGTGCTADIHVIPEEYEFIKNLGIAAHVLPGVAKTCGRVQPQYKAFTAKSVTVPYSVGTGKNMVQANLSATQAFIILSRITEEDAKLLGFSGTHPKNLISEYVQIMSPLARRSSYVGGEMVQSDLTTLHLDMIKQNFALRDAKVNNVGIFERRVALYAAYHELQSGKSAAESRVDTGRGTQKKSIKEIISGKEGVIRREALGRRSAESGRTVLTPGVNVKMDEIGIPRSFRADLSSEETVTYLNKERLQNLLDTDQVVWVKLVKKENIITKPEKLKAITLQEGDIVRRYLMDGDVVIFVRQPTLHKFSMLAYKTKINGPGDETIHVHMANTPGHNADFDGDEGNLHRPQREEEWAEMFELMLASKNIMNHQTNRNMSGLVINALVLAFKMTYEDHKLIDETLFSQCALEITMEWKLTDSDFDERCKRHGIHPRSGKALFSLLFPDDFNYTKKLENGTTVIIREGILKNGYISKETFGSSNNSIIQMFWKYYIPPGGEYIADLTAELISNAYTLTRVYGQSEGFTVGISDCFIRSETGPAEKAADIAEANKDRQMIEGALPLGISDPLEHRRNNADDLGRNTNLDEQVDLRAFKTRSIFDEMRTRQIRKAELAMLNLPPKSDNPVEEEYRQQKIMKIFSKTAPNTEVVSLAKIQDKQKQIVADNLYLFNQAITSLETQDPEKNITNVRNMLLERHPQSSDPINQVFDEIASAPNGPDRTAVVNKWIANFKANKLEPDGDEILSAITTTYFTTETLQVAYQAYVDAREKLESLMPVKPGTAPKETIGVLAELVKENLSNFLNDVSGTDNINVIAHVKALRDLNNMLLRLQDVKWNNITIMGESGAKGSSDNMRIIANSLGPQLRHGKLAPLDISGGTRSLPHFTAEETMLNPEARGMCYNPLSTGIGMVEFFWHAYTNREQIIMAKTKIPETGDIERHLMKSMENVNVDYMESVRYIGRRPRDLKTKVPAIGGKIIQELYGDDGLSPEYLHQVKFGGRSHVSFVDCKYLADNINMEFERKRRIQ